MAKIFAIQTTDPLTLGTDFSIFRLSDGAALDQETIYDPDGVFMQLSGRNITHTIRCDYYIESGATLPLAGAEFGTSYIITNVDRSEENRTHNTITVTALGYEAATTTFTSLIS